MVRVMVGHTEHVFNEGKSIVRHAISERRNCDLCPQVTASDATVIGKDATCSMTYCSVHGVHHHPKPASDPSPELRERGVTLTAEDLADLDDMELHFSNQDTHPRWSRYRRLVTRLFNDDALKGTT